MRRLLVLNNYCFERVWNEIREGEKPDHHLFGLNHFAEAGYEITLAPFRPISGWHRFQAMLGRIHFPIPLGNLDRQIHALLCKGKFDLIYAPCQTETQLLGYLRYLGINRRPMVCLAHHPFDVGRLQSIRRPFIRANVLGTDRFPSLSRVVAEELNTLAGVTISEAIPWGPQQNYYEIAAGPGEGALAAGRTGRDFVTFGRAASRAGIRSRIICLQGSITPEFTEFGANVVVEAHPEDRPLGYRALTAAMTAARVLAVPMSASTSLAGLTSLTDALGVGRPVIMTRNPYVDIDIEALGIGKWVERGNVAQWEEALRWFDTHPDESMAMGRRARALVDSGLNSASFARRMMSLFDEVLAKHCQGN